MGGQCLVLCRTTSGRGTAQIVRIPISNACLKGHLVTQPALSYHEGLAPREGSIRSFERPFHDDLLGQGDLELVAMTYCHTRNGSVHPARSNAHSLATWGHPGSLGDPAETLRVLSSREGVLQQRCLLALQRLETGRVNRHGRPNAEMVLTLVLLAHEVDSFPSNCSG